MTAPTIAAAAPASGAPADAADPDILPDTRGLDLYARDGALRDLLPLYLPADLLAHLEPHLARLGAMITTRLDDLAHAADRHPPVLHPRDRQGRDRPWVEKHPAYVALERIAFGEFGLAALSHRGGVLGWPAPMPPAAKYALTYLFVQAEFGLCCPLSMTDALTRTLVRFGDPALIARAFDGLVATDLDSLAQGAMFITEQGAGSDVGAATVVAERDGAGGWRLSGDKWFCSNPDAAWTMVLARPVGAPPGTRGLGLFLMPRTVPADAAGPERINAYRIVRLKDKLGTRSMASGEIRMDGAVAYLVGDLGQGFKQMAEMINASRLSNGVRAAGLMRRAWHEALYVAEQRVAFGRRLADMPLMRRQLLKLLLPTEQALSLSLFTAAVMARADAGDGEAGRLLRALTPLLKFRACRDARTVTADSLEVRGGAGYIEEWVNPRLVRDALLGSVWEGTSNIVALDVLRAARTVEAHRALSGGLKQRLAAEAVPAPLLARLTDGLDRAVALVEEARDGGPAGERLARQAASGLYHAAAAAVLALEGAALHARTGDARRLLLARLVLDHRLTAPDPLAPADDAAEAAAAAVLLDGAPCDLATAAGA
ncbi:acyl-CoA dehydrogenase family protein [Roseospira goensis]|uniref:Alkylation response protein AidB-like acyl-CoA dehydrogenase n=1 Tax=Roseospira goensis TaxID=391922 RepID=A0A7W6WJY7_9PROT|nr:acyl-CoA dehydrogenase family protein [Roseospira goensis]MBB4285179.1 alkylation response protein AidB-like acyl-CoA dehydrogenase [Roseospira goensis]